MPANIQTNYTADYKDTELGANAGEAANIVSKADGTISGIASAMQSGVGMAAHTVERAGLAMIGTMIGGDLNAARDKLSNRAQNNFLEASLPNKYFLGNKFEFSKIKKKIEK